MKRSKHEVADVINTFGKAYVKKYRPNTWITRTLNALKICRTSSLGGHKHQCDTCGNMQISYNSCRNRHCPKCEASKQVFWIEDTQERIMDVKYFHLVFTVPDVLNEIVLLDSKAFYSMLFASVKEVLQTFGHTKYAVETGAIAILHTWGQNLSLHPHIHCLVPTAGLRYDNSLKRIAKKGKYLYNVKQLSLTFKGKMMQKLKKHLQKQELLTKYQMIIDQAYAKKWVVFSEPSLGSSEKVIQYLGNYTHRVAISNQRIIEVNDSQVLFYYKDYKDQSKVKPTRLDGIEFLRRFVMHILPKGFVKIRYFGILSNRYQKYTAFYRKLSCKVDGESKIQRFERLTGSDVCRCTVCKKGKMIEIGELPRIRAPDSFFLISRRT